MPSSLSSRNARFFNRELSWLAFNMRVLEEAENPAHPLLERLKFLSISSSNLDEFFMVRVAGLKEQLRDGVTKLSQDGLSAKAQLERIAVKTTELMRAQARVWQELQAPLMSESISVVSFASLSNSEKQWLAEYFSEQLFPALSPIAIDPAHPFPFLPNLSVAILLKVKMPKAVSRRAIIPIPHGLNRFVCLPSKPGVLRFVQVEEVIEHNLVQLFPRATIQYGGVIRITRDSDLDIAEEADDLVSHFESAVKLRRLGSVIRLKYSSSMPKELLRFVVEELEVAREDLVPMDGFIGFASIMELYDRMDRPDLKFPSYVPRFPERINDYDGDCFAAIAAKDIVVHHPYESFDVVVQFLRQAARDKEVVAIKQTLYRTSHDSPIVRALVEAAEAGKSVTAVIELKARFDEEKNIRLARDLERAGAQVVYGFVGLKTHAKLSLVIRREQAGLRSYVHMGTGNYHPITAKTYSDLSFFTCDAMMCRDASYVFNFLTGYSPPESFARCAVAPLNLRSTIVSLIEEEIAHAKAGRPAQIWAKMNALVDPETIDALYAASQAGVEIDLIVRGICSLRPGIAGLSERIRVKSIVGRFLEHARIFCFGAGHGLPSPQAKIYLSSADWMPRNLEGRVEIMAPILNATVHEQVMGQIMVANLRDEKQSWRLQSDGTYVRVPSTPESFSAHCFFMTNPSLSGRGKAK